MGLVEHYTDFVLRWWMGQVLLMFRPTDSDIRAMYNV